MPAPLWDDEYTGPRFTYGMTYRPPVYGAVPDGFILFSLRPHPDFSFGTLDYPFALDEQVARKMELTLVRAPDDRAES